jgi:uroporphyrinogen-III synthase
MSLLLVVRPRDRWQSSAELVRSFGHEALCAEVVQVKYVKSAGMDRLNTDLLHDRIATLVFASVTAVKAVEALEPYLIPSIPKNVDVVAIGPPTAKALNKAGVRDIIVPDEYTSQGLVRLLASGKGEVAMLRSGQGNEVMSKGLEGKRPLRELVVYDLLETDWSSADVALERLRLGEVTAVLHTSSMSARLLIERSKTLYPDDWRSCWTGINAAIGLPTRDTLDELGIVVQVMPSNATFRDLVETVSAHIAGL